MRIPTFRIFGGVFAPRLGPALFTLFGVGVLLTFGVWQMQRMAWKHALVARIEARMAQEPAAFPDKIADPQALDYARLRVTGIFRHDKEMHLAARDRYGVFGYHVMTPLQAAPGHDVLVDRGFVPTGRKAAETRREGQVAGTVTVTGIARLPPARHWFTPDNQPETNLWLFADLGQMAAHAGLGDLAPLILEADAAPNPGGYPIGGQTRLNFPDNHLVYAITWFSMAMALAAIFVIAHWRRDPPSSSHALH